MLLVVPVLTQIRNRNEIEYQIQGRYQDSRFLSIFVARQIGGGGGRLNIEKKYKLFTGGPILKRVQHSGLRFRGLRFSA